MSRHKIILFIIDGQNDFCKDKGALYVPGADEDMKRLAAFIDRIGDKIDDIHITFDSHHSFDIAHPGFWVDGNGNPPAPFTMITSSDFESGKWSTKVPDPKLRSYVSGYLKSLEAKNRYAHTIWPEHCLIGSWGHGIHEELYNSLLGWERQYTAMVNTVTKGSNYLTEHFSAVMAENPIPEDPSTHINTRLIQALEEADTLVVAGQALSHCVANTIIDVSKNFSDPALMSKVVLLEDCTSEVPNPPGLTVFSDFTKKFLSDMKSLGMRTAKSTEFLV